MKNIGIGDEQGNYGSDKTELVTEGIGGIELQPIQRHNCTECKRKFNSLRRLNRHVRIIHSGSVLSPVCSKECVERFSNGQALKYHMENYTGEKHLICTFCGKMFSHQAFLQSHLVYKHDKDSEEISKLKGKGRVQCTECGRKLTNKQPLETHVRGLHAGECIDCGKKFYRQQYL